LVASRLLRARHAQPRLRSANSPSDLPRHKRFPASTRTEVCLHLAASKLSTSSLQCRQTSSVALASTASDVLHARFYCLLGGSARIVALHSSPFFQLPNLCSPGLAASLPLSHTRVRATWPTLASAEPLARARQPRLQRPPRALRSTPVQTANFRTPSRARSHHPLGVAHVPAAPAPAPTLQHASSCAAETMPLQLPYSLDVSSLASRRISSCRSRSC
jgi:hypothetical protein